VHVWCSLEQSLIDDAVDQSVLVFMPYFVTINLYWLYLMNFIFHTMIDAAVMF